MSSQKYLCSCGLSGAFPLCDGKHAIAHGREAAKLYPCGESHHPQASGDPPDNERAKVGEPKPATA